MANIEYRPSRKKGEQNPRKQSAKRDTSRRNQDKKPRQEKKAKPIKTAEDLDAEMADYWNEAGGNNAPAPPVAAQQNGAQAAPQVPDTDVGMNEIVSLSSTNPNLH